MTSRPLSLDFRWADLPLWGVPLTVLALLTLGICGIARGDELAGDSPLAKRQLLWGLMSSLEKVLKLRVHNGLVLVAVKCGSDQQELVVK